MCSDWTRPRAACHFSGVSTPVAAIPSEVELRTRLLDALVATATDERPAIEAIVGLLERFCSITGWISGEARLTPEPWLPSVLRFPSCPAATSTAIDAALDTARTSRKPYWTANPDGSGSLHVVPVLDGDDVLGTLHFVSTSHEANDVQMLSEITPLIGRTIQRVIAFERVRRDEKLLRAVVDRMHDIATVYDRAGNIVYNSPAATRVHGFEPDEILGQSTFSFIHPDDREKVQEVFEGLVTGRLSKGTVQYRYVHKQRGWVWMEAIGVDESANPAIGGVLSTSRDITERIQAEDAARERDRAEAALRRSERRILDIVETLPIAAIHFDERGIAFNAPCVALLGARPAGVDDLDACLRTFFVSPDEARETYEQALRTNTPWTAEIRTLDGQPRWIDLSVHRFEGAELWLLFDVTERVEQERTKAELLEQMSLAKLEAERANRAKDSFLAVLSHELRTPLTTIAMWAQMLAGGRLDPERSRRGVRMIEKASHAQAALIEDLLDHSRIASGKLLLEQGPVDPVRVVRMALGAATVQAEGLGIRLEGNLEETRYLSVWADDTRLGQVLSNLVNNALKFTPRGGTVRVALAATDDRVVIRVTDTGIGIQPEMLTRLFEPFVQEDRSLTRQHGGLGLGLSIARDLVRLMGGRIEAESAGPNKGSTFTVSFPLLEQASHASFDSAPNAAPTRLYRLDGVNLLVVDDDADGRDALAEILSSLGAHVTACGSVADALAQVRVHVFDVVVSDLAMPGEDGFALIRQLRKLHAHIPAIALSALASADYARDARAAGFDAHLPKPVDAATLTGLLASYAGRRTQRGDRAP